MLRNHETVPGGLFQIQFPGAPIDTKKGGKTQMDWAKCNRGKSRVGGFGVKAEGIVFTNLGPEKWWGGGLIFT